MTPFTSITGPCIPVLEDDLNTDQIAPIQMSRELKPDYADLLFNRCRSRRLGQAKRDPTFRGGQDALSPSEG
jgi:3-isopropylmalate dehydratase small subunit